MNDELNTDELNTIDLIKQYFIPNAPEYVVKYISEIWMLESELTDYMNRKEEIEEIIDKYLTFYCDIDTVMRNLTELWLNKTIPYDVFLKIRDYYIKMDYNMKERLVNHLNERCKM